jgi:threonine dehydrogenase-like Zn-dependent dehydrogenase
MARKVIRQSPFALFGYSHMPGGIPDCQAQYLRVPYGNVGPIEISGDLTDEQVLFLSNVFPTGVRRDFGALFREGHDRRLAFGAFGREQRFPAYPG